MIDLSLFRTICVPFKVDPVLAMAIATVESGLDPNTARYEPKWRYLHNVKTYASALRITVDTERVFQSTSWGLMQIMGTVAREQGYTDHLTKLIDPNLNIIIGARKLQELSSMYADLEEMISSYNQGSPRRDEHGMLLNKAYVSKVLAVYYRFQ